MSDKNSTAEKFTSYQKFVLAVLALLLFVVMLDFMIISPIGDILIKSLNITTKQFGLVVSSYIFSAAITGFVAAGFIDRFDRKKVLLFFFTGFITGTLFCALSNSYYTLLSARIITGIFGGVVSSVTMTIVSDLFAPNQRGRAMSIVQMAFSVSQIIGIPLGIFIAGKTDWHFTFYLIVILSSFILLAIILKIEPITGHINARAEKNPFLHLWKTIKNKRHQAGFITVIFLGMGMMMQPFISTFLVNNIQISKTQLPLVFMASGAAGLVLMPLAGKLSDRFDKFRIFLWGSVATMIIVPVYTHLPVVPLWVVLIINVTMFAVIMSRMAPFQALNTMIPMPADRGAYMSISSSLQQISGGLGIVIAGSITYQPTPSSPMENFDVLGYVVVALSALACYLVYRVSVMIKKNTH